MVQRTFPDGLDVPANADGASAMLGRVVANRNGLPVDGIDEVRVLDPYFHH